MIIWFSLKRWQNSDYHKTYDLIQFRLIEIFSSKITPYMKNYLTFTTFRLLANRQNGFLPVIREILVSLLDLEAEPFCVSEKYYYP